MRRLAIALGLAALFALEASSLFGSGALAQDGGVRRARRSPAPQVEGQGTAPRARADGGTPTRLRAPRLPRTTTRADGAPGPAQAIQPQPTQAQPTQAQPSQAQPSQAQPTQAQPTQAQPTQAQPTPPESLEPPLENPPSAVLDGGVPLLDGDASIAVDALSQDGGVAMTAPLDGGPPDAGPPDGGAAVADPDGGAVAAAPVTEPPSEGIVREVIDALARFGGREQPAAEEQPGRAAASRDSVLERPSAESEVLNDLVKDWLGVEPPPSFGLVVLLGLAIFALWLVDRAREPLPERGLVPRLLGAARLALRLSVVLLVLMLASRLLPDSLQPLLFVTLAAAAFALGFGAVWVLLPDVVGGIVLLTEGRLKRGQWITGEGFAGSVEQVGPRVTLLRAADGALLAIPNRVVVRSPVRASDRPWHEVDVEVRTPPGIPAQRLRDALREAVLCSPYVPSDPGLVIARDPTAPDRWRLKLRLIDAGFTAAFEGQLLERVEESLALTEPKTSSVEPAP